MISNVWIRQKALEAQKLTKEMDYLKRTTTSKEIPAAAAAKDHMCKDTCRYNRNLISDGRGGYITKDAVKVDDEDKDPFIVLSKLKPKKSRQIIFDYLF